MVSTDQTKQELQEELRRRDLPVSGSKQELLDRLQEHDEDGGDQDDAEPDQHDGAEEASTEADGDRSRPGGLPAGQVARLAARHLASLTRRRIEAISGLARDEDGWRVEVEVVEVSRVPSSTDVLGTYAVWVDREGELISYERVERFVRGQASHGEG